MFTVDDPGPWKLKTDLEGSLDLTGGSLEVIDGAIDTFEYGVAAIILASVLVSLGMTGVFSAAKKLPRGNDEAPTQ